MKVYLAGNLHTDWRYQIVEACPDIEFLQPYKDDKGRFVCTEEGVSLIHASHFTLRDLLFVSNSDVVFGFITVYGEHSRHHGLMIELGYAKALGIPIVLVCEIPTFDMAIEIADVISCSLVDGARYLNFLVLKNPI